eukprot:COSAG02_NODE_6470_length_3552_cov_1.094411_1_plen_398_part_00
MRATNGVGWSEWSSTAVVATSLPTIVADIRAVLSAYDPWRLSQLLLSEVVDRASGEALEDNYRIAHGETLAEAVQSADLSHWMIFRQILPSSAQPSQFLVAENGNAVVYKGGIATMVEALRNAILLGDCGAVVSLVLPAPGKENRQVAMSLLAHEYYKSYGYTISEHLKGRFSEVQVQEQQSCQEDNTHAFGLVPVLEYALNKATADSAVGTNQVDILVGDLEKLLHNCSGGSDSKAAVAATLRRVHRLTPSQRHEVAALYEKRHDRNLRDVGGGSPSAEVMAWGAFRGVFRLLLDTNSGHNEGSGGGEAAVKDVATQLVQLLKVASDDLGLGQPRTTQAVDRICQLLLGLTPSQLPAVASSYAASSGGRNLQRDLVSDFVLDGKGLIYLLNDAQQG